jgi:hypothetical protein
MSNAELDSNIPWQRWQRTALLTGTAGLGLCAFGYLLGRVGSDRNLQVKVFFSYLFAYHFWLGLGLGSLGIWMLHHLTGGAWGFAIRRFLEASTRTLPLLALLFLPLAAGIFDLYVWANPDLLGLPVGSDLYKHLDHLLEHKRPYLNVPFFLIRAAVYFAIWIGVAWALNRWAAQSDARRDPALAERASAFSGRALVFYFLAVTFAAFDWLMSLEPTWFSTIFGVLVAVGQVVPALAFAIAGSAWLARRRGWDRAIAPAVWNDLGNLQLASVMLWAYLSFSQLLLIWSGNLHEEIPWYILRSEGGWQYVGAALGLFYFAVPFALLLSRRIKRNLTWLMRVGLLLLVMSVVYQFWLVNPVYSRITAAEKAPAPLSMHWLDLAALVGVGGLWLAFFLWQLQARPLTPPADPLVQEVSGHA